MWFLDRYSSTLAPSSPRYLKPLTSIKFYKLPSTYILIPERPVRLDNVSHIAQCIAGDIDDIAVIYHNPPEDYCLISKDLSSYYIDIEGTKRLCVRHTSKTLPVLDDGRYYVKDVLSIDKASELCPAEDALEDMLQRLITHTKGEVRQVLSSSTHFIVPEKCGDLAGVIAVDTQTNTTVLTSALEDSMKFWPEQNRNQFSPQMTAIRRSLWNAITVSFSPLRSSIWFCASTYRAPMRS